MTSQNQNRLAVTFVLCLLAVFHQADSFRSSDNLQLKAPVSQKRIGDSLREKLVDAYNCTGNKGCLGFPTGCIQDFQNTKDNVTPTTCDIFLSWAVEGGRYEYELVGPMPSDGYIAMGFSEDQAMGEDSVAGCYVNGGIAAIHRFVNPSGRTANEAHGNLRLGLRDESAEVEEGHLFCEFEQETHNIEGKINVNLKDNKYYYLLAKGSTASQIGLSFHTVLRQYSADKISVGGSSADSISISKIILGISVALSVTVIIPWS